MENCRAPFFVRVDFRLVASLGRAAVAKQAGGFQRFPFLTHTIIKFVDVRSRDFRSESKS